MFRNNYDNDAVTFSPQGRIFQVEYAQEAVKQGSVVVGLVNKTHCVLVGLKRNAEELSSYQKKIIEIDSHMAIAIAGLASDARVLSNFMKQQSLGSKMTYGRPIPLDLSLARSATAPKPTLSITESDLTVLACWLAVLTRLARTCSSSSPPV